MNAHYFAGKEKGKKIAYIIISEGPRPIGQKVIVAGKKQAKDICKKHNLKPWNF